MCVLLQGNRLEQIEKKARNIREMLISAITIVCNGTYFSLHNH